MPTFHDLTTFLTNLGIEQIAHTQKNYLAHLIAVYKLMQSAGCDEDLCRAGLFHSIYGTEKFQGYKLPETQRAELATLIGLRPERLAWLNCFMDRASLDELLKREAQAKESKPSPDHFTLRHRETGALLPLTPEELTDLCAVHLYDWLEQAPRSRFGLDYRRQAYRQMAERLGTQALEIYDRVFA